jgi:hypothetical protein
MPRSDAKADPRTVDAMSNAAGQPQAPGQWVHEAPGIEQVLTPEGLEREVLYAGGQSLPVYA